jgi:hypothetical protein
MATTPTWLPLGVAFLGLGGVLLTQHLANRREDARWHREREREQTLWAREDAARSYEHRRNAYVDFIKEFNRRWDTYVNAAEDMAARADSEPDPDFLDPLYGCLIQVQIFGTKEAAERAQDAYDALAARVFSDQKMSLDVLVPLQSEIRRDLSIPDRPL